MWSGTKKKRRRKEKKRAATNQPNLHNSPHKQTAESTKQRNEPIQRFTSNRPPDSSTGGGWGLEWGEATLPPNPALMPNILDRLMLKTQNPTGSPHSYLNPAVFCFLFFCCGFVSSVPAVLKFFRSGTKARMPRAH